LEEANDWPGKKVTWADVAEVHRVERWIGDLEAATEIERYIKELEDDSDEEWYVGDIYGYDEMEFWDSQNQSITFPKPPRASIQNEEPDNFPPFLSQNTTNTLSDVIKESDAHEQPANYISFLQTLHETLEAMGHHRRMFEYQAAYQAGQVATEDRATRTN
jgi:hypothetical protein